MFAKVSTLYMK